MQLRYLKTILPPSDGLQKVTSLTWAANKWVMRCAKCTHFCVRQWANQGLHVNGLGQT